MQFSTILISLVASLAAASPALRTVCEKYEDPYCCIKGTEHFDDENTCDEGMLL